jgi:two-component system sensor histidine kinase UhpB
MRRAAPAVARGAAPSGVIARILRVPLFWKLLWSGVAVSTGTALFVLWVAARQAGGLSPVEIVVLLAGLTVGTAVVQAVVLRVALSPLALLEATAQRVGAGQWEARADASRVEDARIRRLRLAFNGMLDQIGASRRREARAARETLEAEEGERDLIARELYGEPAQALAGLLVRLRVLVRTHPEISGAADDLERGIREALEEVRRLARRLRPPELDELGVRAALAAHVRLLMVPHQLEPVIRGTLPDDRMAPEVSLTLFRICQAAITKSVSRDPQSSVPVSIAFATHDDRVVVDIRCPPDPSGPGAADYDAWAERVRWTGGQLSRREDSDGRRRLRLSLPLSEAPGPSATSSNQNQWEHIP